LELASAFRGQRGHHVVLAGDADVFDSQHQIAIRIEDLLAGSETHRVQRLKTHKLRTTTE
jgi:hypothetical protein